MPQRFIPFIWLRLIVIILFGIFLISEKMWLVAVIAAGLALLSAYQLYLAYQNKK
ncbi:hypothetical membrane protein [Corynebacterium kutscheri]|uniref:Uncharacterized protein n=1 Tax=Corynebacterium kutscheri TaxID=35755 RepID=A0A0F6R0A7_9CORY|nr:hypothetical protein [Corynebacterium kutscheri]AKE41190.1 hypothetical protein UL82_05070 [Corynebacterium kutscheri]VEH09512.1 hypothetical membrane protein [Corynebacterium kutscheri]VEH79595.1 hypothetical membrane protein [Corynebacterium kutscheri]